MRFFLLVGAAKAVTRKLFPAFFADVSWHRLVVPLGNELAFSSIKMTRFGPVLLTVVVRAAVFLSSLSHRERKYL
ncbi:MAG: hypothetical protein EXR74_01390 [Bdellovibrionales bacterium]|nr:hypothetical protein [Bdellovibrionales bacterium]